MIAMEFYFPGGATELKFSDLAPRPHGHVFMMRIGNVIDDCLRE